MQYLRQPPEVPEGAELGTSNDALVDALLEENDKEKEKEEAVRRED